jgi:hypothetical protein
MKFNTAVCFFLSGITLYLQSTSAGDQTPKKIAGYTAFIILFTGLFVIAEYFFNWNPGIDEFLWKEGHGTVATVFPGRMSLITAFNFLILGLIFLVIRKRKYQPIIQFLLFAIFLVSFLVVLNHLSGTSVLTLIPYLRNLLFFVPVFSSVRQIFISDFLFKKK